MVNSIYDKNSFKRTDHKAEQNYETTNKLNKISKSSV